MDLESVRYGRQKISRKEGWEEGSREATQRMVQRLLASSMPVEEIATLTALSVDVIEALKEECV